jgi:hypothetical protein
MMPWFVRFTDATSNFGSSGAFWAATAPIAESAMGRQVGDFQRLNDWASHSWSRNGIISEHEYATTNSSGASRSDSARTDAGATSDGQRHSH